MNKPTIQKDGLTYIWQSNVEISTVEEVLNGVQVTTDNAWGVIENAIIDRPIGSEDRSLGELEERQKAGGCYNTIAQNEGIGLVGIYVLADQPTGP